MTFGLAGFMKWVLLLVPIIEKGDRFRATQLKPKSWGTENREGIDIRKWVARTQWNLLTAGEVGSEYHLYHLTPNLTSTRPIQTPARLLPLCKQTQPRSTKRPTWHTCLSKASSPSSS